MSILDTDHCIAILRKKLDLMQHVSAEEELYITVVSVAELTHGAERSLHRDDNLARLEVLLAALTVLPFDESSARRFGQLKAELETRGQPLDDLDLEIASIALENKLPLVTNNTNHLKRIEGLELQNWIE
ncbi:MAG TPA: PIN domain-containing protein [Anaerolineales bacterium]|nr:PIN domain-containing protein [Anaerolineales bacterium]